MEQNKGGLAGMVGKNASESKATAPAAGAKKDDKVLNQTEKTVEGASEDVKKAENEAAANTGTGESEAREAHEEAVEHVESGGEGFAMTTGESENNPATADDLDHAENIADAMSADAGESQYIPPEHQAMADEVDESVYSSHPIANLKLGKFQFVKGVLRLNAEDAAEFDKLLSKQPPRVAAKVQKIDREAGERVARQFRETTRTRGFDTAGARSPFSGR